MKNDVLPRVMITDNLGDYLLGFAAQQHDGTWTVHSFEKLVVGTRDEINDQLDTWEQVGKVQSLTDAMGLLRARAAGMCFQWTPSGNVLSHPWSRKS
jgi:hypothetical protein